MGKKPILTVPERHQLRIARETLAVTDAMVGVMGGPNKPQARRIIFDLTGRWPCDNHPARWASHSKYTELLCDECVADAGGLAFLITPKLIALSPSVFGK